MAKRTSKVKAPARSTRQPADIRVGAIETGELRLVDRSGRVRAVLSASQSGPSLAMMHEDGTVALELVLGGDGPAVRLSDDKGETRVFIGAVRGAARIGMADGNGFQRLFLGVSNGGTPAATLYDSQQRQVWSAGKPSRRKPGK